MRTVLAVAAVVLIALAGCGGGDSGETETQVCVDEQMGQRVLSCDQETAVPVREFERFHDCVDELSGAPAKCGAEGTLSEDEFQEQERTLYGKQTEAAAVKKLGRQNDRVYRALRAWARMNPQQAADACLAVESVDKAELRTLGENYLRRSLAPLREAGVTPDSFVSSLSSFCADY